MRRLKAIAIFVIGIFSVVFVNPAVNAQNEVVMFDCLQSFEYFAYAIQEDLTEADELSILWVPKYQLFDTSNNGTPFPTRGGGVLFSRTINDEQEIWLRIPTANNGPMFAVYNVNNNSLDLIPLGIENSFTEVQMPMVDDSGRIWASVTQSVVNSVGILPGMESPYPLSYAPVAVFDDSVDKFVPFSASPQIPFQPDPRGPFVFSRLILDSSGIPWLLMATEDIYRLDSITGTFQLVWKIDETRLGDVTPTLNDSILISLRSITDSGSWFSYSPVEDHVFEIFPDGNEITNVPAPPIFLEMSLPRLFDRNNRAWFSAMAYLENEQWTIVNPDLDRTRAILSEVQFPVVWIFPTPILSDSSGRMWFETRDENSFGTSGTAWLDPETGNGCKFSNSTGNVIEDNNGFLWLFDPITGTLYRSAESNSSTVIHP